MWGWYKAAVERPPPPARVSIATMTAERIDLYRHITPSGETIPVGDLTFLVDDSIPEDEYITWEVSRLCLNCSGGPSEMRVEHLCQWLVASTRDDSPDATNWHKVVAIVQAAFRDGAISDECTCNTVMFIPKGKRDFQGIGLVGVLLQAL